MKLYETEDNWKTLSCDLNIEEGFYNTKFSRNLRITSNNRPFSLVSEA